MKAKQVKVYAPASIANVGAGFDVLGIAIDKPGDIVVAERILESGLRFSLHDNSISVPADGYNIAACVAQLMLDEFKPPFGISLTLHKKMPIASGLGSSGASCAAAAFAVNALLPKPLPKNDLLRFAVEGERIASGAAHADNVAPSLLGGVCLIHHYQPLEVIKLPIKNILYWVVVHPNIKVETHSARDILPKSIALAGVTAQLGHFGGLITGLMTGDTALVGKSIKDNIAEPVRANLIPGFSKVKAAALSAGALGFSISGSGPSVFAVATSLSIAKKVAHQMQQSFGKIKCDVYISKINMQGTKCL